LNERGRRCELIEKRVGISFHFGIGGDNLLHNDRTNLRVRFSVANLTNSVGSQFF